MTLTKEKISLMQELGMSDALWLVEREEKNRLIIEEMTALKFKPISDQEVRDRLLTPHRHKAAWDCVRLAFFLSAPLFGVMSVCFHMLNGLNAGVDTGEVIGLLCLAIATGVVGLIFLIGNLTEIGGSMREIQLRGKNLSEWTEPISQGALLAVKEAKAKGLDNFMVYYPIKDKSLNDPIIVGHKNGLKFEVAYWDDNILREERASGL